MIVVPYIFCLLLEHFWFSLLYLFVHFSPLFHFYALFLVFFSHNFFIGIGWFLCVFSKAKSMLSFDFCSVIKKNAQFLQKVFWLQNLSHIFWDNSLIFFVPLLLMLVMFNGTNHSLFAILSSNFWPTAQHTDLQHCYQFNGFFNLHDNYSMKNHWIER